eukprot:3566050-Prorocentrum_lima.AAC.1
MRAIVLTSSLSSPHKTAQLKDRSFEIANVVPKAVFDVFGDLRLFCFCGEALFMPSAAYCGLCGLEAP